MSAYDELKNCNPLNFAPSAYRPVRIRNCPDLGVKTSLRDYYEQYLVEGNTSIVIGATSKTTTPEVNAALRALLCAGCCKIEKRSQACREIFIKTCMLSAPITAEAMMGAFVPDELNPFTAVIQQSLRELLEGSNGDTITQHS